MQCICIVISSNVVSIPTGEDMFLHTDGRGSDVRVMPVRLPSAKQDQESVSLSSVEGDTDSSANDVF